MSLVILRPGPLWPHFFVFYSQVLTLSVPEVGRSVKYSVPPTIDTFYLILWFECVT